MGIILRQSFKGTIALYMGVLLGYLNTLFLLPYFMTESEIGILRFILEAAVIFSTVVLIGSQNSLVRFYPRFKPHPRDRGFAFMVYFIPVLGFVFFLILFQLFRNLIEQYFEKNAEVLEQYFHLLIPMVLFASLGLVTETYASIKRRITVPKLLKEVGIRLLLSLGVVLYGLKMMNYDQALSFIIWGNGLLFVANTIYIYSIAPFDLRPDFTRISRVELKEWIKYSSIIFIGSFSGLILTKLDFVMVSSMLGMAETGIYSTMFYLGLVIEMPRRSLTQISAPIMAEHLHRNEMDKVKHLYQRSSINMLLVGVVLFLGLWINVEYLFELMPKGEIFSRGLWVFFFIALGKIANLAEGLAGIIISNSNFYRYSVLMSFITTAVAIGANLFLIPRYGMTGAAMATAFSLLILSLYSIAIVYHKLKVHPFVRAHLHLMIVLVVILLVNQILNIDTGMFWLNVLCTNIIILLPTLWLIWKLKISEELNDQLSLVIKRYWNK